MTEDELRRALLLERFGPVAAERVRPISKATGQTDDHAGRRLALANALAKKPPALTRVEFRNRPEKAPWVSDRNRAEAGG